MNNITTYIIEKLKINKDSKLDDNNINMEEYFFIISSDEETNDKLSDEFIDSQIYVADNDLFGYLISHKDYNKIDFKFGPTKYYVVPEKYKNIREFERACNAGEIDIDKLEEY